MAALRAGCGLAYVATPREVLPFVLSVTPELVGIPLGGDGDEQLEHALETCDSVVAGPGLGKGGHAIRVLRMAIKAAAPLLLDADALNLIAAGEVKVERNEYSAVLTPHPGEMARLAKLFGKGEVPSDDEGRLEIAVAAARFFRQIIVLKGHRSVITDGERYAVNTTGDSTLAKAGSGDVLSGMIGTLLGQKVEPFEAAWMGCYYHGLAGEHAGKLVSQRGALARDVVDAIPYVMR
jgi:NAD(P)H-hydrate epimerase